MRFAAYCVFLLAFATVSPALGADMSIGTNFTVLAPNKALADAVVAQAEIYRTEAAREWLAAKLPDRQGRTLITVEVSAQSDEAATWPIDCRERTLHQIWLTTSPDRAVGSTLHHEVVHTVLDTHFYPAVMPAWASEGIASQADDAGRQQHQRELVARWSASGNWPSLKMLFAAPRIGHDDLTTYAAASSVTQFLAARGGKPRVVEFAAAGPSRGWDQAARDCFGFNDVAALETAWRAWAAAKQGG